MSDEPKITVHVSGTEIRNNIPEYDQSMPCPTCSKPTKTGFGLAGGGFGIYSYCEDCEKIVSKSQTEE